MKKTEYYEEPILTIEVWDNDIFTPDDFIGEVVYCIAIITEFISSRYN